MHVSLPISKECILMGSDSSAAFGKATVIRNNIVLSINAGSKDYADKLFKGFSDVGKITMPLNDTFWGAYFGMQQINSVSTGWLTSIKMK